MEPFVSGHHRPVEARQGGSYAKRLAQGRRAMVEARLGRSSGPVKRSEGHEGLAGRRILGGD